MTWTKPGLSNSDLPPNFPQNCPCLHIVSSAGHASHVARTFTTVIDAAGLKVAAIDNGQPMSAVTLLAKTPPAHPKAGSRFENKPGVAHALKNFAFKVCYGLHLARLGSSLCRPRAPQNISPWGLSGRVKFTGGLICKSILRASGFDSGAPAWE